jgi:predicted lysophospholipase L1 biosynthesis ABC-type transport system permease subunit
MKTEQEYIRDLTEIRSMMERSTKFLSLTGWSGIMAGAYALAGAYIAKNVFYFNSAVASYHTIERQEISGNVLGLFLLALLILVLAIGTAIFLSYRKAKSRGERLWNSSARRLVLNMAIPLGTGGILILILLSKGLPGLVAPLTMIFYGMALLNASKFTYEEVKYLGLIEIVLGLIASYYIGYGLLLWAIGFGIIHIIYGIYMHLRYEK